jgi:hypothetical protein
VTPDSLEETQRTARGITYDERQSPAQAGYDPGLPRVKDLPGLGEERRLGRDARAEELDVLAAQFVAIEDDRARRRTFNALAPAARMLAIC